MAKIIKVYAVYETLESLPGGVQRLVGIATNKKVAEKAARGRGPWGSKGLVAPASAVKMDDGMFYLLENGYPAKVLNG
jgi:hypothetical protein